MELSPLADVHSLSARRVARTAEAEAQQCAELRAAIARVRRLRADYLAALETLDRLTKEAR